MEREDIIKIINESPLSIHLSEKDKMELVERVLSLLKNTANDLPEIKG